MVKSYTSKKTVTAICILFAVSCQCFAVTTKITSHSTAADFTAGETKNTVIESDGTIKLARNSKPIDLKESLKDAWIINSIVEGSDGSLYLGTSPNGAIIKYKDGKTTKLYPIENTMTAPADSNSVAAETFTNEHIFAMAIDSAGRLLAAVSGKDCRLMRFTETGSGLKKEDLFSPKDTNYIFAITLDMVGNIYLATGPNGKIYTLNVFGQKPELVYDCPDKNVLAMTVDEEGFIYAGCGQRGIIYKIDTNQKTAVALYDSEQSEITALLLDEVGNLYVAATSDKAVDTNQQFNSITSGITAGRPDTKLPANEPDEKTEKDAGTVTINIANIGDSDAAGEPAAPVARGTPPKQASHIYKINPQGFVTDIFAEMALFFAAAQQGGEILVGTGNSAKLFSIDPQSQQTVIAYQDEQASQITALAVSGQRLYLGTSNPPKLIALDKSFAGSGTYTSELIDAGQPAKWGKLQLDADIPEGSSVLLSVRSGNVEDPNDPTFSQWTEAAAITEAIDLLCPAARFCQYKLILKTESSLPKNNNTPVIRRVAAAHVIPNLPPRVVSVSVTADKKKPGIFTLIYLADDDNNDKLVYAIELKKLGREKWIELEDKLTVTKAQWDTKTVEDGRYEIRITASDRPSNTTANVQQAGFGNPLTASRISDPFVVDNTGPAIEKISLAVENQTAMITLNLKDAFSAIGDVSYTIDSNEDFQSVLPNDMVYDTTAEEFVITIDDMQKGLHIIALKISDSVQNTIYKTLDIEIK
jgi:WD40 repeat protein